LQEDESWVILGYTANYHLDEGLLLETYSRILRNREKTLLVVAGADFEASEEQMQHWGLRIYNSSSSRVMTKEYNILHLGRRPFKEMNTILACCDILLLPLSDIVYNRGRWPHKIGDYLAAARPMVVNDVGDIPELIRGKQAGYITAPNPKDFAEKTLKLIRERDSWERLGKNGRRIAETALDWERIGNTLWERIPEQYK